MKRKPVIGITAKGRYETNYVTQYYDSHYVLPSLYVDAVRRAGGIPVILPPGDESDPAELVAGMDAIIFAGGSDVNPANYKGNTHHPALTPIDPERDATEFPLVRYLVERKDMPLLFICRGMQLLNVALGGALHEHVADVLAEDIHRDAHGSWALHDVQAQTGSRLVAAMGADKVQIYSGHHQAIKRVADPLHVVATAPDGVIEALEMESHPWLIAVQWHPEKSAAVDATQQHLFDALVAAAIAFADAGVHHMG